MPRRFDVRLLLVGVFFVATVNVFWSFRVLSADSEKFSLPSQSRSFVGSGAQSGSKQDLAFGRLLRWIHEECGGHVAPVRLGLFGGIRGLQAGADLRAGEIALRIPRRCCLTSDALSNSSQARFLHRGAALAWRRIVVGALHRDAAHILGLFADTSLDISGRHARAWRISSQTHRLTP